MSVLDLPESVSINDAVGFPVAAVGSIVATGVGSVSLYGNDLASAVSTDVGVSIAAVLYVISFAVAWITNDRSIDDFSTRGNDADTERLLVLGAPALMAVHEFVPAVENLVTSNTYVATVVALVLIGAYGLVAHY
jgi:hypothetical protein